MTLAVSEELLNIFKRILERNLSLAEWCDIESDDEFQTANYCGGFDATEEAFCFSYFDANKTEYWFQKSLEDIHEITNGRVNAFQIRPAE